MHKSITSVLLEKLKQCLCLHLSFVYCLFLRCSRFYYGLPTILFSCLFTDRQARNTNHGFLPIFFSLSKTCHNGCTGSRIFMSPSLCYNFRTKHRCKGTKLFTGGTRSDDSCLYVGSLSARSAPIMTCQMWPAIQTRHKLSVFCLQVGTFNSETSQSYIRNDPNEPGLYLTL